MDAGFTGKNVIITGASGGIGASVARCFAAEGANIVVHYNRGESRARQLRSELADGTKATLVQADLTDETAVHHLFKQASSDLGPTQILIANAGDWPAEVEPISRMSVQRWQQTIANNLTSVFLSAREFLRQCEMARISDPSIVMIGSTAGHFGEADHGDYAAAKSGLMGGLLQSLKNEIPQIFPAGRINVVCPGWTMTPMARKFQNDSEAMIRALQTIPLRKFASPDDIANAILFLASNRLAGHITGQALFVSGGMEGRVLNSADSIDVGKA